MLNCKSIAGGLCAITFFCTLLCMLLSAAGLWSETRVTVLFTAAFLVAGFLFALMNKKDEEALTRAHLCASASRAAMNEAILALDALEQQPSPEAHADFQEKSARALMQLGDVRVTAREWARMATAKAIEAQHALRQAYEQGETPEQLAKIRTRAEELAAVAVREIQRMS